MSSHPLEKSAHPPTHEVIAMGSFRDLPRRRRVLYVEDDETTIALLRKHLSHTPFSIEYAQTGKEAIRMYCAAIEDGRPFDVIVLDVMLPDTSGLSVAERVREDHKDEQTAIIFCTNVVDNSKVDASAERVSARGVVNKAEELSKIGSYIEKALGAA